MWLKLIGGVMVVVAGGAIGFSLANRYNARAGQLRQLICCLTSLDSYINYICLPLPEALRRSGDSAHGPVRQLFHETAGTLETSGWLPPREALCGALARLEPALALAQAEKDMLLLLGTNLGFTNREEQRKYLAMVVEELEKLHREALQARDQNVKMYRYLGICGGLAVVIILV
jgi:stage III sporulation protein AB